MAAIITMSGILNNNSYRLILNHNSKVLLILSIFAIKTTEDHLWNVVDSFIENYGMMNVSSLNPKQNSRKDKHLTSKFCV